MTSILGIPLPTIPIDPGPTTPIQANDSAVPDQKIPLSQLMQQTGWGQKGTADNDIGRMVIGAESGYDPKIDNHVCCIGLLQMNLNHAGEFGIPAEPTKAKEWLKDPTNNLRSGRALFQSLGGDWNDPRVIGAWQARQNNSYLRFKGQDPLITVKKNTASGEVTGVVSGVGDLISALFQPSTYFRIGKGVLGGMLIIIGTGALVYVVANKVQASPAGKTIKKVAETAAMA